MKKILLVTSNQEKIKEYRQLLQDLPFEFHFLDELKIKEEPKETGHTFKENAFIKSSFYLPLIDEETYILSDDSGLNIIALPDILGVNTHKDALRFGSQADFNQYLVKTLKEVRDAYFTCVICLMSKRETIFFEGRCEGRISKTVLNGPNGFGYDPIFIPKGHRTSFSRLDVKIKNAISHRARASQKLKYFLKERN
ncbi:MAG: hypothetical protein LBR37_02775 [Erysipelotrichaceae bacterium]|jgi:XTP/dITP diphosphohydrolase|nr:hypothetical protein [Erysipelotrichaceae bacterium]